jgi:hypothetical protein
MSLSNSFNVLCIDEDGMHSDTCSESPHEPLAISDSNHFEIARLEAYNADNDGLDGWEIVAPKSTRWNDGFAKTSQVDDWFVHPDAQSPTDEATSWNAIDSLVNPALPNSSDTPSALDTIPYPLCEDGDLVEIDIEAHYANGKVCEVGISHVRTSALPTATAKYLPKAETDDCFSAAWDAITSTTFAISDNTHKSGHKCKSWCKVGDSEQFAFGDIRRTTSSAAKYNIVDYIRGRLGDRRVCHLSTAQYHNSRKVVFLFFAQTGDQKWLKSLGIDLAIEFPNSDVLDLQQSDVA